MIYNESMLLHVNEFLCMVLDWFYASPINEYFLLRVFSGIVLDESSL